MSRFRILDAYKPGYSRTPADSVGKVAPPGGAGTVGSQVMNQAQAERLNARSIAIGVPPTVGYPWTLRTMPATHTWVGLRYVNNRFAAISYDGIAYSTDGGATWPTFVVMDGYRWDIAYGAGLYVVTQLNGAGSYPRILTSPDGVTWTPRATPDDANEYDYVSFLNGKFIAPSRQRSPAAKVLVSTNGIDWAMSADAPLGLWGRSAYGAGLYVTVGHGGGVNQCMTSPDAQTWTARPLPDHATLGGNMTGVAYGAGLFVASYWHGSGRQGFCTSPDGVVWTRRPLSVNQYAYGIQDVTYAEGMFVAALGGVPLVLTSVDGITWLEQTVGEANLWNSVAWGGGRLCLVSEDGVHRAATAL